MKKKKLIILSSICLLVIFICILLINDKSNAKVLEDNQNKVSGMYAIMLETEAGSGSYEPSTSSLWPSSGYIYNETLSRCENGGELTWHEDTRTVSLKTSGSDKCYLYFDVQPPDITIATNNSNNYTPATPATLNCSGATAEYNPYYQRLEISQINKYTNCSLTYQTPSSKTYLNNYIIGLSGSTQGDGQVVDEPNATIADYTNATAIAQSNYRGTTMYSSRSYSSTSGTTNTNSYTFSGESWTSVPSNMTSGIYYHIKFKPSSSGYYQVCYTISSGNSSNKLYIYNGTAERSNWLYASSVSKNNCIDIGYVDTSTDVRIVQYAYSSTSYPIATITFNLQKATSIQSVDTGYRYEGKNPNNYIWFNNELWRIIGVFDETSHGQSGQNLVKIIRADSIGGLVWNGLGNNWATSFSMNLLNGAYLNAQDGTESGYCYGYASMDYLIIPRNCDYTIIGINSTYRNMIANVKWYLGGYSSAGATPNEFYGYERGTTVYSGRPTEWEGKIGLMYPSDYGYSVLSSSCARTTNLSSYNTSTCAGESWLYGEGYEWTLTPNSVISEVFYLLSNGNLSKIHANDGSLVRPVLYLDSSVYVIDGNGTISDPYIIGM